MKRAHKISYSHKLCCFDIETTHENINGIDNLYCWHWQLTISESANNEPLYYTFSSWPEFYDFIFNIERDTTNKLIIFVHNLSYEAESIFRNPCGHEKTAMFAPDTHKVLTLTLDDKIEFRCSYFLTSLSLADCGKTVGLEKMEMDYSQIRKPGDAISENDAEYCKRDVIIMDKKIRQMETQEQMPFWEFPLTNTSFLRNELRKTLAKNPLNRKIFLKSQLDYETFNLVHDAYMGGYTHANYLYTGKVMENVDSFDFGSAYPFNMAVCRFPMGAFHKIQNPTIKDLTLLLEKRDKIAFVIHATIANSAGKIIAKGPNTFLSSSKCKTTPDVVLDNGRVYSATGIEFTLTNLDYEIMQLAYTFDKIHIIELYWTETYYLPPEMIHQMLKYYELKQTLKIPAKENPDIATIYMKAKGRVNSYYGMSVTMPIHDEIILKDDLTWDIKRLDFNDAATISDKLAEYYKSRNSFLPYQWGVWVTAWTRYFLWKYIISPCGQNVLYCDTDSAKVINLHECIQHVNTYNQLCETLKKQRWVQLGIPLDAYPDLGYFDHETKDGPLKGFKTWGAKKYLVLTHDGHYKLTVAGLSKKAVSAIISFDDFTPGTIFAPDISGRTVSHCINNTGVEFDGGGCYIENTTYRLTISTDYEALLAERDGITVTEFRSKYSDLILTSTKRYHAKTIDGTDDSINFDVILDKRNMYGVKKRG